MRDVRDRPGDSRPPIMQCTLLIAQLAGYETGMEVTPRLLVLSNLKLDDRSGRADRHDMNHESERKQQTRSNVQPRRTVELHVVCVSQAAITPYLLSLTIH